MSEANDTLTIDVVSDVVCPWCYLGEKRLEMALAEAPQPVALRWRPYQLDPTIPDGGLDRAEYMAKKFGKSGRLQTVHDNLTRLGAEVGLPFAFDKIKRAPNTLDAHRLIRWANSAGAQGKVVDRLFKAYFVEGRDIGDRGVLIDIAGECGLDVRLVEKLLAEGADADLVREEIAQAQAIGVSGVPFFIFAGRLGVPGAQDPSVLVRAMAQARQAMHAPIGEATVHNHVSASTPSDRASARPPSPRLAREAQRGGRPLANSRVHRSASGRGTTRSVLEARWRARDFTPRRRARR